MGTCAHMHLNGVVDWAEDTVEAEDPLAKDHVAPQQDTTAKIAMCTKKTDLASNWSSHSHWFSLC